MESYRSRFNQIYKLLIEQYDSQGNVVQAFQKTQDLKQVIKSLKHKFRNIKQILPEFKYSGFIIGRSVQFNTNKSVCMLTPAYDKGSINFGDIIVCWKNPKDDKDVKWFCLQHFCQAFGINKDQLLNNYLTAVNQNNVRISSQVRRALEDSINWTQMRASKWGRTTYTYQDWDKDPTACTNPQMLGIKQLNKLKGHIINYQTNDALNQYYLVLSITSGSILDRNVKTDFQIITKRTNDIKQQFKSILEQIRPLFNTQEDFAYFKQQLINGNLYSTQRLPSDNKLYQTKYIRLPQSKQRKGVKFKIAFNGKGMKKSDAKALMESF